MAFLQPILDSLCQISIISRVELLGFAFPNPSDEAKAKQFVNDSAILPLTNTVAGQAIEIRKALKIKLGDALIAATALTGSLTLLTRNENDFKNVKGLKIINPFTV